jgi:hypothetical protein
MGVSEERERRVAGRLEVGDFSAQIRRRWTTSIRPEEEVSFETR